MIKAIIFDCFGVLTVGTWQRLWSSLPNVELQEKARELNRQYDAGNMTQVEFAERLHAMTDMDFKEIEAKLFMPSSDKNEMLLSYIKNTLKPHYKIGLLSNIATDWIREEFLTEAEQALFDDVVLSHEVRLAKPDPAIFELACQRLSVNPEETIFIDDIARYTEAAKALGIQAILYEDFGQMKRELEATLAGK